MVEKSTLMSYLQPRKAQTTAKDVVGVAIIGTADPCGGPLTVALYEQMLTVAAQWIDELGIPKHKITLLSGGAAVSDHVAVDLFLRAKEAEAAGVDGKERKEGSGYRGLTLFLPCEFDVAKQQYVDNGQMGPRSWQKNPGQLANVYHRRFSKLLQRNTLRDIANLTDGTARKAKLDSSKFGFHARNSAVAAISDYVLAFTWQQGKEPQHGGTADTWKKAAARAKKRHHICLWDLLSLAAVAAPDLSSDNATKKKREREAATAQSEEAEVPEETQGKLEKVKKSKLGP